MKSKHKLKHQHSSNSANTIITPMVAAAALDASAFSKINATEAIPESWEERARRAWEYYIEEPLVKNCINSWRTFAVGDEIKITSDNENTKSQSLEIAARLKLTGFIKDMILQLLVKGDAVGFKRYSAKDNQLEELVCVNPISVKVKYAQGELIEIKQFQEDSSGADEGLDLPVEQVIHLKWDAPAFSPRGNSLVLPAFQAIELLRDYRRAEQAIAKRWTTPFRLLKVGGSFGQKLVMPDQRMLEQVRDMVNKMDLKSGLVVPFYVDVETHGTDGQVLNVEDKVKEVKEDIVVALGLSRSLVTGDGPNFATASVSMQKMMVMIREIKQAARQLLDWVFKDQNEQESSLQFIFNDLDPSDAVDFKKLLIELYDRKLISRASLQIKMDLDPEIEKANLDTEAKTIDLLNEKQIRPLADMVIAGILSVADARKMLGLPDEQAALPDSKAALLGITEMSASAQTKTCGECSRFDLDRMYCPILEIERSSAAAACRFCEPAGNAK